MAEECRQPLLRRNNSEPPLRLSREPLFSRAAMEALNSTASRDAARAKEKSDLCVAFCCPNVCEKTRACVLLTTNPKGGGQQNNRLRRQDRERERERDVARRFRSGSAARLASQPVTRSNASTPLDFAPEEEDAASSARRFAQRVALAAQYAACAVEGQPLQLEPHSRAQRRAATLTQHWAHRGCVTAVVLCSMVLAPFSSKRFAPALETQRAEYDRGVVRWVLACCVLVLVLDAAVQTWVYPALCRRRRWIFRCVGLGLVALCVALGDSGPTSLCGAPALLLMAEFESLRRTVASMIAMTPAVAPAVALFAGVLLCYAQIGVLLFKPCYSRGWHHDGVNLDEVDDFDDDLNVEFRGAFDTITRSTLSLFVLSSTENFPFVMFPAMECDRPGAVAVALAYFLSFIFIVIYVLISMVLAAFYEAWKLEHEERTTNEQVFRCHALVAAYHALLGEALGERLLTRADWEPLAKALRPRATPAERELMFDLLEPRAHHVSLEAFVARESHSVQRISIWSILR